MSECAATLEVNSMQFPSEEEEEDEEEPGGEVWGRLFPLGRGFIQQGVFSTPPTTTHPHLMCLSVCVLPDLVKDEYVFGRGEECDYSFEENGGKANPHFLAFSKTHFRLYRVSIQPPLAATTANTYQSVQVTIG